MMNGYIVTIINLEGDEKLWIETSDELLDKLNKALASPATLRVIVEKPRVGEKRYEQSTRPVAS